MPTKKKRVGFIPRANVLDIINKLSFENNLSNSKIINILVEEALSRRGILNIKTGNISYNSNNNLVNETKYSNTENPSRDYSNNNKNDYIENLNSSHKGNPNDLVDLEIYQKFLMFLQFQEKMKQTNIK